MPAAPPVRRPSASAARSTSGSSSSNTPTTRSYWSHDDLLVVPGRVAAVPGAGKIVTVFGHSTISPVPWVVGGAVLLVVAWLVVWLVRRRAASG